MSWGYFTLDYITIEKMSSSNAYTAAENLVDPYASQSTQRLYSYMKDVRKVVYLIRAFTAAVKLYSVVSAFADCNSL